MLKLERTDVTEGKMNCTKNTGIQKRLHYHEVNNEETSTQKKKRKTNRNSEEVSTEWIPDFLLERIRNSEIAKEHDASNIAEKSIPYAFAQQGGPQNPVNRDPFATQPANRNLSSYFFIEQGMRKQVQNQIYYRKELKSSHKIQHIPIQQLFYIKHNFILVSRSI